MSANPITFEAIEAFNRLTFAGLGPWEVDLICRIDDVVLGVYAEQAARGGKPEVEMIPLDDGAGVRAMMQRLTIQVNAQVAAKAKAG